MTQVEQYFHISVEKAVVAPKLGQGVATLVPLHKLIRYNTRWKFLSFYTNVYLKYLICFKVKVRKL